MARARSRGLQQAGQPDAASAEALREVVIGALRSELAIVGVAGEAEVQDGVPATAILSRATALGAWLVVVGTHGRGGVARFVLGSVAEKIVRDAPCSVLVVR